MGVKRCFDVVVALVSLIVLLPLLLLVIGVLLVCNGGKIFFKQERIGRGGKPFLLWKFRTMYPDSEGDTPQLESDTDPRVTQVGRFLRRHHLDELPQLWNVLRGDMSIVGPRPERAYFIAQIVERDARYSSLYQIRPGLTSEATLYNGYTSTIEKMVERLHMDLHYLETGTLLTDVCIIFHTVRLVIVGDRQK